MNATKQTKPFNSNLFILLSLIFTLITGINHSEYNWFFTLGSLTKRFNHKIIEELVPSREEHACRRSGRFESQAFTAVLEAAH